MANITQITDSNFDSEVIAQDKPVLVDFWADWCGPCKMVGPHLEALARDESARLSVKGLDIDNNPNSQRRFGVMSIPTMILFVGGEEKVRLIGAESKEKILKQIEPHLATAVAG